MSISLHLRRAGLAALELIFPARCAACDASGESPFCAVCAETLVPLPAGCPVCGVPQDETLLPALKPRRCPHCRVHPPRFAFASAPYLHGGALAEAIHRLKYERREDLGPALGVLFEACPAPKSDVLVPMGALLTHGNICFVIAATTSVLPTRGQEDLGIAFLPLAHALQRVGAYLGIYNGVRGAFATYGRALGLRVCLIDDVLTTGATASAAAAALLEAGAARVEVRTLARAP